MEKLREAMLQIPGGAIPITLLRSGDVFTVAVDGVHWLQTTSTMHAVVLFEMMRDHLLEYMHYEMQEGSDD